MGWARRDWNGVVWDAVRKCEEWGSKQSDGTVWDDEKEWDGMKWEAVAWERVGFNGKEMHEMECAGAKQIERKGWKIKDELVCMDGEEWEGAKWKWVGRLGTSRNGMGQMTGNGLGARNGEEWMGGMEQDLEI